MIGSARSLRWFLAVCLSASILGGAAGGLLGACGPFTDVAADAFCPFVLEIFYLGITTGTTATTFDPATNVTRLQMAAFLSRTVDSVVKRSRRRAALGRFWTSQVTAVIETVTVGATPQFVRSDGEDLWVSNFGSGTVSRVHASSGRLLETWTGAAGANNVLTAFGQVFVNNLGSPGGLYQIDPRQTAGAVTTVATNLGPGPRGLAFDGARIWSANFGPGGSVSIVTPGTTLPWTVTTVATGFTSVIGSLFDGSNVWVTDFPAGTLLKLDSSGAILQTVTLGGGPSYAVFDGTNIWVPQDTFGLVSVVRASTGAVLATISGFSGSNGSEAAFDGERILVTNSLAGKVSLWKAADLTSLGNFTVGGGPFGACSDGLDFWIALSGAARIARF